MSMLGAADPAYLSYMRALGLQVEVARQVAARNRAAIARQVQTQQPEIARLGLLARQRIGDTFESRGVFRSGMRSQRQAEQGAREAYQVGQLQGGAADRTANVQSTLDQTLSELARQRAERQALYGVNV